MGRKNITREDPERGHRTACVTSRFSPAELEQLEAWRGEVPRGEYVRKTLLGRPPRPVPKINADAYRELARAAGNLNQLARRMNEGGENIEEIRAELKTFRFCLLGMEWES